MALLKTIRTELSPAVARSIREWTAANATLPANEAEHRLFVEIDSVARHVAMAGARMDLRLPIQAEAVPLFNRFLSDLSDRAETTGSRGRHERPGVHRILIDAGVYRPEPGADEAEARRHDDAVIRHRGRLYTFQGWLPEPTEPSLAPTGTAG